ncbi:MAG: hypothetical protein KME19_04600 [Microcoleus vaginatus WJT46-NPBG5]|nr:hypothetical protein [Microcoleus vaginatus WJT46-NPBG5]
MPFSKVCHLRGANVTSATGTGSKIALQRPFSGNPDGPEIFPSPPPAPT